MSTGTLRDFTSNASPVRMPEDQPRRAPDSAALNVHILLPVHNRIEITRECLKLLGRQTLAPAQLIVIDDGSNDGTSDMVKAEAPQTIVIRGDGSLWWAGSLQVGLNFLSRQDVPHDDVVLFLNDDTSFDEYLLEHAARAMASSSASMLLAQAYSSRTGKLIEVGVRVDWKDFRFEPVANIEDANCLSTRGLFIRLGDALRVGGFRPRLLPHYLSDYEFTIRARRKGVRLITDPAVKLIVNEDATGQRLSDKRSLRAYLRSVFTKRSVPNPFYWTSFMLLACPPKYLPLNVYRVWRGFLGEMIQAIRVHGR